MALLSRLSQRLSEPLQLCAVEAKIASKVSLFTTPVPKENSAQQNCDFLRADISKNATDMGTSGLLENFITVGKKRAPC